MQGGGVQGLLKDDDDRLVEKEFQAIYDADP